MKYPFPQPWPSWPITRSPGERITCPDLQLESLYLHNCQGMEGWPPGKDVYDVYYNPYGH